MNTFKAGFSDFLASGAAVLAGLFVGLIVLFFTNASQAIPAFLTILTSGFSSLRNFGDVLYFATPIIMTGLSVGFAYKTGLFNIGATGQFTFGAFAAIYVGVEFQFLPPAIRIITALVAAMLCGALWAAIPGLLKAYRNVHEVISCIMSNYIGMFLVNWLILNTIFDPFRAQTAVVPASSNMPRWGMNYIFTDGIIASSVNSGIIVALAAAVIIHIVLNKTKFGFELKAAGFNKDAAKYAGIAQNRNIVLSMMISGALAGLGGALLYLSGAGISMNVANVLAAEGFTGISVAFLALGSPIGIIFTGMLIAYLHLGGFTMQLFGFVPEIIEIVISVIIYFSAFSLLMKIYLTRLAKKRAKEKEEVV
ncbi:MAG: ABC transporter permease [Defluviitaleaceae bacterium]|nr:ABC transporter permease [Defluviitaleaceae bacterium]